MKRLYVLFLVCFFSGTVSAQVFGNEWIVFPQRYLKVKVVQDGIYRVDSTTLSNAMMAAGASLGSIDPRNLQVFHNGQEEYIWVEGETDGAFDGTDYLEFYGQRNDGAPDSSLYGGSAFQLNPYYSLYNDTAIYFITWNGSTNNRRLADPNDTNFSAYTPAQYFTNREVFKGTAGFLPGVQDGLGITDPAFIPSEGYYDNVFDFGQSAVHSLNSRNAYSGGNAAISVRVGSHSNDWNVANDNTVRIQFLSYDDSTTYDGYDVRTYNYTNIPAASLSPVSTAVTVSSINLYGAVSSGRTAVAWITLTYPHTFDMEGRARFNGFLPDNTSQSKSLVQLTNVGGSGQVRVYDLFNHHRINAVNNGSWDALVANGNGSEKPFVVNAESNVIAVTSITAVNGNGEFTDFSQFAADSVFVIITHRSLWNVAQDYRIYRSSPQGGSRNVVVADVAELYDQFGWGIGQHPLSIRRFADFMIQSYPSKPGHLLLLGKSIYGDQARMWYYADNLVPTYGYPPCDNSLTAGLNGTNWEPAIATGRIAARDSVQARWYLDKVIGYESEAPAEWMKHVLHFGGGSDPFQQSSFSSYLLGYENIIEDTLFGGTVQTYLKTSISPIQINQSDSLRQRIEDGVSIMTFFGHASGTGFDQSIDDPSTYNNVNRYPFLIANSCYAGDIHSNGVSSSEAFTLIDEKGTIGYVASVGVGVAPFLNVYSDGLYKALGKTMYGMSVGDCIRWAVVNAYSNNQTMLQKATCMEMTLQGDPSVVINSFPLPDYEITNNDVWFDQETQPDSFTVYAKITNLAKAVSDTFIVHLLRTFPGGESDTSLLQIAAPKYRDTVSFTLPVDQQRGIGLNRIRITVDYFGQVMELNENNNSTQPDIDLLLRGSAIVPVYPYDFAVIPVDTITLTASTVNAMEPVKTYRFELDTTDLFNSPFKISYTISSPGGVVKWHPNVNFTDSTVYFWRVSPDSLTAADVFVWRESSFQYITGKTGWGQDHIFQYTNDGYQYVQLDRNARHFDFVNDIKSINVKNGIYYVAIPWNENYYKINGATQHIFSCVPAAGGNGLAIAVIDPVTGIPWSYSSLTAGTMPGGYYNCVGNGQVLNAYDFFDNDTTNQGYIRDFLDSIPNGYRVLVYSQDYGWYSRPTYEPGLQQALRDIGSGQLGNGLVADSVAFIVWGTKGAAAGTATEVIGTTKSSVITLQDTLQTNWNSGFIATPVIGPAAAWGSLHWKQHGDETPDYDYVGLEVYGVSANGTETLIITYAEDSTDVYNLGSVVNVTMFPYLRLKIQMVDDTDRTPPQIDRLHVLYTPVPELAVNPQLAYNFLSPALQEGASAKLSVGIENLTPWNFTDSLLFTYWLIDADRVKHPLPSKLRAPSFNGFTWFTDTVSVNTEGYPGANELWIEVNPVGNANTQLEQHHFNNVLMVPFEVSSDNINPLLDVTFDGVHIMDGDIVSGKPGILVTLKDENQFLALNDTNDFQVFLKAPSQAVAQLMPWGPEMLFTPAMLPNNSCRIYFTPNCAEDGIYELIVQAKDRSNNQSGLIDYKISFEVINAATVTNVLNYPNPFSTSTQFVFTLTGTEVPELFTIQIMTVTGKVVREIDRDELGDLHIGRNITTYAWDGRDEFGDQLANGVYLYRVITRLGGQTIDHRESGADPYINHGWGKMYLMR